MITKRVAIVLGAGASKPYGFPTGAELVEQILLLKPELRHTEDTARIGNFGLTVDEFTEFRDALRKSLVTSVDLFLETHHEHEDYMRIGKRLIAGLLIPCEDPNKIRVHVNGGWYDYLADLLHASDIEDWKQNKLKVVSFNYDRSLEFAIWGALRSRYGLTNDAAYEALKTLRVVHVYGSLGNLQGVSESQRDYSPIATTKEIESAASNIKIVHESEDDTDETLIARDLLSKSDEVVFLGFGYHPTNIRRLKLGETLKAHAHVYGSMMGFSQSEWRTKVAVQLRPFGNRTSSLHAVSDVDRKSDVLTWIRENLHLFKS